MNDLKKVFKKISSKDLSQFVGLTNKEFEKEFRKFLLLLFPESKIQYQPNGSQASPDFCVLGIDIDIKGTKRKGLGMWNSCLPKPGCIYIIANKNECRAFLGEELFPDLAARKRMNSAIRKIQQVCKQLAQQESKIQKRNPFGKYWGIYPRIAFEMKKKEPKDNFKCY